MKRKSTSKKVTGKAVLVEIICFLLVLLFLYASIIKFRDYDTFQKDMFNQPFKHWFSQLLVWALPKVEILIAALVFSAVFPWGDKLRTVGLYAAFVLVSLFTLYAVSILANFFPRVPCSCGGLIGKSLNWTQHAIFTFSFVAITAVAILLRRQKKDPVKSVVQAVVSV